MQKSILSLIIFFFLFNIQLLSNNKRNDLNLLLKKGSDLYTKQKYYKAIDVFSEIIKKDKKHLKAYLYRGSTYAKANKLNKAILDYSKVIQINPNNYITHINRGYIYFVQKRYSLSISDFNKASYLKKNNYQPHQFLVIIYSILKNRKQVFFHIEQSVIKGFDKYNQIHQLISDKKLKDSYAFYKFILSLKIKYKFKTKINYSIPFHKLSLDLKDSSLIIDPTHKSHIFQEERNRLGKNFEKELWKFLGNDIDKHYYFSSFLEDADFLHGNKPLFKLSFKIRNKGIKLCKKKKTVSPEIVSLAVFGAIVAYKNDNLKLARKYKKIAQKYLKLDEMYKYAFPAIDEKDRIIYNKIK